MKSRAQQEGALPPRVSGGVAHSLPCLFSNNVNGHGEADAPRSFESLPDEVVAPEIREKINLLQSNHKKTAALLAWTIFALAETYGVERMGMLTLTFADHVTESKEAARYLHPD